MTGSTAKPGVKGSITQEQAMIDQVAATHQKANEAFAEQASSPENYRMPIGTSEVYEPEAVTDPWPLTSDFDWIADLSSEVATHLLSALHVHANVAKHALLAARHRAAHPEGLNPNHAQLQGDVFYSELSVTRSADLVARLEGILS